jgi:hypothetical protein
VNLWQFFGYSTGVISKEKKMEPISAHRPVATPTFNPKQNDYPAQLHKAGFISDKQFTAITSGDETKIQEADKEAFEMAAFVDQHPLTDKQSETIKATVIRTTTANSRTVQSSTDNSLNDLSDSNSIDAETTTPTPVETTTPERTTTANSRTVQSSTDNSLNNLPDSSKE